ncbi:hypothetical protein PENTCL1PPCAC_8928 [Pristionchus entomophagus]|uniref:SGNH domain-containing protein n=1 Tax=Pristionchus entomophagus TaxID=358040 RepID=A0AAV5SXP0_9BILA|nr:hypothetical protein PENTCL1PPCAC_8928 [Pristionchus entomophagus]
MGFFSELKDCTPRNSWTDKNPWGFCNLPAGNGSLSFLVIGNSYAANHGRLIVDDLKEHYGRIAVHTVSECEPLIETKNYYCKDAVKLQQGFLDDIDTFKPDVLFLSSRYIEPNVPIDGENVQDDVLYKSMMEKLRKYEQKVKKVFILQAFPRTADLQNVENARIKSGKSVEGHMEEAIEADSIPMRRRIEEIAKHCEKCVVYDLMNLHMENGTFMVTNPVTHLHYFEALRHHTPIGLQLVEPLYRKLSDNFDDLMKSRSSNNVLRWTD